MKLHTIKIFGKNIKLKRIEDYYFTLFIIYQNNSRHSRDKIGNNSESTVLSLISHLIRNNSNLIRKKWIESELIWESSTVNLHSDIEYISFPQKTNAYIIWNIKHNSHKKKKQTKAVET